MDPETLVAQSTSGVPESVSSLIVIILLVLATLGGRLVFPLSIHSLSWLWPHVRRRTFTLVTASAAPDSLLLLQAALLAELALDGAVWPEGTDTLEAGALLLPAVLAVMTHLDTSLALQGLAKAGVDVSGGGAPQSVTGGGKGGFLAVATEDIGVVGLIGLIDVGGVGVAGRSGARRMCLSMEFGALVSLVDLAAGLVLKDALAIGNRDLY